MSEPKKPQRPVWPIPSTPAKPVDKGTQDAEAAGHIEHNARGDAVWTWNRKSDTDSTTHLLRKLESPELELADESAGRGPDAPPDAGIDPYQRRNERRAVDKPQAGAPAKEPQPKAPKDSVLRQLLGKR